MSVSNPAGNVYGNVYEQGSVGPNDSTFTLEFEFELHELWKRVLGPRQWKSVRERESSKLVMSSVSLRIRQNQIPIRNSVPYFLDSDSDKRMNEIFLHKIGVAFSYRVS